MSADYVGRLVRREDRYLMTGRADVTRGVWPDTTTVASNIRCAVRPSTRATTEVTVGGDELALHVYDIRVPWTLDIERDDVVTVTDSADPNMVGRSLTVVEVTADEWAGTRMVVAQESRT